MAAVASRSLRAPHLKRHFIQSTYILISDLQDSLSSELNCSTELYIGKEISTAKVPIFKVPRRTNTKNDPI